MIRNFIRNFSIMLWWAVRIVLLTTLYPLWYALVMLGSMVLDDPKLFLGKFLALEGEMQDEIRGNAGATVFFGALFLVPWFLIFGGVFMGSTV